MGGEHITDIDQIRGAEQWIIIADLDGTIIDSEAINFALLNQLLEEFGYLEHRATILRGLAEGRENEEIMKKIDMTQETKNDMENRMTWLVNQVKLPLLPGVSEVLRTLKDMGLLLCIATDNNIHTVTRVINEHNLNDVFESKLILARDTFPALKPSPDIVKELMKRSCREKVIIVGNTPKEVALARNSECPIVIITDKGDIERKENKKKDSFEYEWKKYGGFTGKSIFVAHNWAEAKNVIIRIIQDK